jgi:two-component sensor histidine kinase
MTLLEAELAPYRNVESSNIALSGPAVTLNPRAAVMLGLAFHELATNAAKHGALSASGGKVQVDWHRDGAANAVAISWTEHDGPTVAAPPRRGFGRILLERALNADLRGEVDLRFLPEGVTCDIRLPA